MYLLIHSLPQRSQTHSLAYGGPWIDPQKGYEMDLD